MSKHRNEDLKMALRSAAKTFSADKDIMIDFSADGPGAATDCGKAMFIRDPDVMAERHGFTLPVAEMIAKASMTHEAAHVRFRTNVVEFQRSIIKAIKLGADRELAFNCINLAEDMRVDWLMGAERPGYLDMRVISARDFIVPVYKRTDDAKVNAHLIVTAMTVGVDLGWDMGADWQMRIDKAVALYEAAKSAKSQEEGAKLGWEVYVALYGMPTPRTTEEPPPEMVRVPSMLPPDKDEDFGDLDEDEDDMIEDEEEPDDESEEGEADDDSSGAEDSGEDDVETSPLATGSDHGRPGMDDDGDRPAEDPDDSDAAPVDDDPWTKDITADDMDAETDKWLKGKSDEVLHGDALAEGLGDEDVADKLRRDATLMRGDAALAKMQEKEKPRTHIERTALSVEIENLYSKGDNAGVQMWYTKPKEIDKWAAERKTLRLDRTIPAMINTLTQTFKDTLRKGRERDTYLHRSGSVRADRVWRGSKLGDGRIFVRHEEKSAGGYAIKLLLDASGSMSGKDRDCAVVSYVLTRALLNAGMAVSVECFDAGTDSCGVVHSVLLPWNSGDAERVLAYHAKVQNRDGYSIRAAGHDLLKRQERNKIMIILSDGAPCHGGISTAIRMAGGVPGDGYGDTEALIADAAKAVRELRAKNVKTLGVYFGGGYRAKVEQEIYGKDYVPVTELARFADTVRGYLTRIIAGV